MNRQKTLGTRDMLEALEKAGQPHTYVTLLKYERDGVALPADVSYPFESGRKWRFYTKDRIVENVKRIKEYRKKIK